MSAQLVTWSPAMSSLGDSIIAIGVFDGVHRGHQSLLRDTVAEAAELGVDAVAVTFDRDPDQVVAPQTAAPQLLSLTDKLAFIAATGVDSVLVIPFTPAVAELAPQEFLDSVLLTAVRPLAVHVGCDFRFGSRATGDVTALERSGTARGFRVVGHDLVALDGAPVTSTRIRRMVAAGDIASAARLLGRVPRVSGVVRRGRGDGANLGFPTANVTPDPYAALPADGVYAGRAILADGSVLAAAISVGTPPSFPEARDYLEAHLIGFEGDLYDQPLTLEFFERLRGQTAFASLPELTAAIAADVEQVCRIAGSDAQDGTGGPAVTSEHDDAWNPNPFAAFIDRLLGSADDTNPDDKTLPDGSPLVADRAALDAAERALAGGSSSREPCSACTEEEPWVAVLTTIDRAAVAAGVRGFMLAAPLEAAGIPFVWDPYAPEDRPAGLPGGGAYEQPFTLLVPTSESAQARQLLAEAAESIGGNVDVRLEEDDEPWVDDQALLEAAEGHARTLPANEVPIDWNSWLPLLAEQPYDRRRLLGLQSALESVGIPVKWDPFSPAETPLLKRGFFRQDRFTLAVPGDRLEEARQLMEETQGAEG